MITRMGSNGKRHHILPVSSWYTIIFDGFCQWSRVPFIKSCLYVIVIFALFLFESQITTTL